MRVIAFMPVRPSASPMRLANAIIKTPIASTIAEANSAEPFSTALDPGPINSMIVAIAPGPASIGMASGKNAIWSRADALGPGVFACVSLSGSKNIRKPMKNRMIPIAARKDASSTPICWSTEFPTKPNAARMIIE